MSSEFVSHIVAALLGQIVGWLVAWVILATVFKLYIWASDRTRCCAYFRRNTFSLYQRCNKRVWFGRGLCKEHLESEPKRLGFVA